MNTLYVKKVSPWENACMESFNSKLRDELPNRELFLSLAEDQRACRTNGDWITTTIDHTIAWIGKCPKRLRPHSKIQKKPSGRSWRPNQL